jgi:DNA-binding NtrC family response regulator
LDDSIQLIVEGYGKASECLKEIYRKPDIVVLDYYLDAEDQHSLNGLELMQQIHDRSPDTQVIIVSGQKNSKITSELIKYGAFSYIAKDQYYERQLQEIITEMLKMNHLDPIWSHIKAKRAIYFIYGLALYGLIVYCLIRICS